MVGSYICKGKQPQVCSNIRETDSFTCGKGQTNFNINYKFDCNEKYLIYLLALNRSLINNM